MLFYIRKLAYILLAGVVATVALRCAGSHPGSMRFSVVRKLSMVAAAFYAISENERLTSSGFWIEAKADSPQYSPIIIRFLAIVTGIIAVICFFCIDDDT